MNWIFRNLFYMDYPNHSHLINQLIRIKKNSLQKHFSKLWFQFNFWVEYPVDLKSQSLRRRFFRKKMNQQDQYLHFRELYLLPSPFLALLPFRLHSLVPHPLTFASWISGPGWSGRSRWGLRLGREWWLCYQKLAWAEHLIWCGWFRLQWWHPCRDLV